MSIFSSKKDKVDPKHPTTINFFIGAAEAEAEATVSQIKLDDFFDDFLDVLSGIENGKFIILGRKGSGKSALGEHIMSLADKDPNSFCSFIKKSDVDIEHIVQIGKDENVKMEQPMLYKWLVLTKLLELFLKNESLSVQKYIPHIKKFNETNSGFIALNKNEMQSVLKERGCMINIEHFKRAALSLGQKISIKEEKAPYYKILPALEKLVVEILKSDKDNEYYLIFDDLDISFNCNNQSNVHALCELIRIAKHFNNDVFARNNIKTKIILLLRTDISSHLHYQADMSKVFSSYAVTLNWYEDQYRDNELRLKLRQFINKRIKVNFEQNGLVINDKNDPWTSFVDEKSFCGGKTGFKYILDNTFYRPRDLILFFKNIDVLKLSLPIARKDIDKYLLGNYSVEAVNDIKGELSAVLSGAEIDKLINVLHLYDDGRQFTYEDIELELQQQDIDKSRIESIINIMFEYSLIGNMSQDNEVSFKFREKNGVVCKMNKNEKFILHYCLKSYFKNN